MTRLALAIIHLLGFGVGLGAIAARASWLSRVGRDAQALPRAFVADNWWGISALLSVGTGLWRALAGTEKSAAYYWGQPVFWSKMGLLTAILLLELWPMITLIRWRIAAARQQLPEAAQLAAASRRFAWISRAQLVLLVAMVTLATMLARGYGMR
ncbi:MAG: DUF2214 family protein [Gemmatimonadaceae bacterium]|jgi:putative membrane protein|nr:DUF2214 family protein [Gemmatimonadaceae bacterium]